MIYILTKQVHLIINNVFLKNLNNPTNFCPHKRFFGLLLFKSQHVCLYDSGSSASTESLSTHPAVKYFKTRPINIKCTWFSLPTLIEWPHIIEDPPSTMFISRTAHRMALNDEYNEIMFSVNISLFNNPSIYHWWR